MAVRKKAIPEIEKFIDKGADVKASKKNGFKNILVRVPVGVLTEVDEWLLKKPWLNRTQWIVQAMYQKLVDESYEGKM
jgi:hypothetical protein